MMRLLHSLVSRLGFPPRNRQRGIVAEPGGSIVIGSGAEISETATLYCRSGASLRIGDNVTIADNVLIEPMQSITIADNVRIERGARIVGSLTIGNWAVIEANAVASSDVPAHEHVPEH